MFFKLLRLYLDFISKISLKTRFIAILFINSLVTLALIGSISYYNISMVQKNKIQNGIQVALDDSKTNIESTYNNIGNISKQLAYENSIITDGKIGSDIKKYIDYIDNKATFTDYTSLLPLYETGLKLKSTFYSQHIKQYSMDGKQCKAHFLFPSTLLLEESFRSCLRYESGSEPLITVNLLNGTTTEAVDFL